MLDCVVRVHATGKHPIQPLSDGNGRGLTKSQGFFNSSGSHTATAWPHSGQQHIMQVVLGCKAANAPPNLTEIVHKHLAVVDTDIAGHGKETGRFHAGFLHEWNDLDGVFGENLGRLRALKEKYDPENRFDKSVPLVKGGKKI